MSAFTDQLAADLSTFLNVDEFAAEHTIDGATVDAVLDESDQLSIGGQARGADFMGVSDLEFTIYARSTEIGPFAIDQRITVDGRQANVIATRDEHGLRIVRARWWQS